MKKYILAILVFCNIFIVFADTDTSGRTEWIPKFYIDIQRTTGGVNRIYAPEIAVQKNISRDRLRELGLVRLRNYRAQYFSNKFNQNALESGISKNFELIMNLESGKRIWSTPRVSYFISAGLMPKVIFEDRTPYIATFFSQSYLNLMVKTCFNARVQYKLGQCWGMDANACVYGLQFNEKFITTKDPSIGLEDQRRRIFTVTFLPDKFSLRVGLFYRI